MAEIPQKLYEIDVVRWQDGKIHVLGQNHDFGFFSIRRYLHHSVHDAETGKIVENNPFKEHFAHQIVLMTYITLSLVGVGIPALINYFRPSVRERGRKTEEYYKKVWEFEKANMADLRKAVKDIRVYQGTLEEVSKDIRRPLKRVETKKPETFIQEEDSFWLRVRAYEQGADAIVHYQPGSSIGTLVKYVDDE